MNCYRHFNLRILPLPGFFLPKTRLIALGALLMCSPTLAAQSAPATQAPPSAEPSPPPVPISLDSEVSGVIDLTDPVAAGRHYDDYLLRLVPGNVVQIDMVSAPNGDNLRQIDSFVEVRFADRPQPIPIVRNDNGSDTSANAQLFFAPLEPGNYIIRAEGRRKEEDSVESPGMTGAYVLTVHPLTTTADSISPLLPGQVAGVIDSTSPAAGRLSRVYHYIPYTFAGVRNERIRLDMVSADFDSRLELLDSEGHTLVIDDNSGGDRNARIVAIIPRDGPYLVRAETRINQVGRFALALAKIDVPPSAAIPPLRVGGPPITGQLTESSPAVSEMGGASIDYLYQTYPLHLEANQTVTIFLNSDAFDPYLEAGIDSPLGFAVADFDDDGGGRFNSRLVLHAERRGDIMVRARSLIFALGQYTLRVVAGDVPSPAEDAAEN